ncbi:DUF7118 family protein [Halorarius litoreus]|uniref:DUF7118 family protein n=1 Tax=Halorarius litoreus TaxID=2962676 RepID=UPI0020CF5A07|nr:hypothetical protein [Halorarius litoreus]
MTTTESAPDPAGTLAALDRAVTEYERVRDRIEAAGGESAVRKTTGAFRTFHRLLDDNEEAATGSGFEAYINFQEAVADHVDDLDESLPAYDAFEAADDAVHKKRLSSTDFDRARELLDPAREYADLLVEWEAAQDLLREARSDARRRLQTLDDDIERLERLQELADVDIDAPVEEIREPIETYNEAVMDAFRTFKREASAREVLEVVAAADAYPLVAFRSPPSRMAEFVHEDPVGEESITTLLEYADYSASKLGHYVDNPGDLKRHIATNTTYLTGLDASPLTVAYPPPAAETLRYECKEYTSVCNRFAPEDVQARLREVRSLPETTDYERLRTAAMAREELGEEGRERLASGGVARDLQRRRAEREALERQLDTVPEP